MILTVLGRLWVYCSNLPQGFSTFTEGGLSPKYISSLMPGKFKPSVPFLGDCGSEKNFPEGLPSDGHVVRDRNVWHSSFVTYVVRGRSDTCLGSRSRASERST